MERNKRISHNYFFGSEHRFSPVSIVGRELGQKRVSICSGYIFLYSNVDLTWIPATPCATHCVTLQLTYTIRILLQPKNVENFPNEYPVGRLPDPRQVPARGEVLLLDHTDCVMPSSAVFSLPISARSCQHCSSGNSLSDIKALATAFRMWAFASTA